MHSHNSSIGTHSFTDGDPQTFILLAEMNVIMDHLGKKKKKIKHQTTDYGWIHAMFITVPTIPSENDS